MSQLRTLAAIAQAFGAGYLELTSRGNVQIRALDEQVLSAVAAQLSANGLLPSTSHERVRNIVASPFADRGIVGKWDVRHGVIDLDRRIQEAPRLAQLSGRFLFSLDDGSGDTLALNADLGVFPTGTDVIALVLAGTDSGIRFRASLAIPVLMASAHAFLDERSEQHSDAWRLADLHNGPARVRARLRRALDDQLWFDGQPFEVPNPAPAPLVGVLTEGSGSKALGAVIPLGQLSSAQAAVLAALGELGGRGITITPWRTVLISGLNQNDVTEWIPVLHDAGMSTDPRSPWTGVTSCAGRPRCTNALADVRADASDAVRHTRRASTNMPFVHWAGCERRCGRPSEEGVEIVATRTGYDVYLGHREPVKVASASEVPAVVFGLQQQRDVSYAVTTARRPS